MLQLLGTGRRQGDVLERTATLPDRTRDNVDEHLARF
jgi:hypothetical protein